MHRLFFSVQDSMCFVAVQDVRNGAVVTVLPLDYHEALAWPVSNAAAIEAQRLATGVSPAPASSAGRDQSPPAHGLDTLDGLHQTSGASQFRLTVYFWQSGGVLKAVDLGSWPCRPYEARIELLLGDDSFFAALDDRLRAKHVEKETIEAIYVRAGTHGTPVRLAWTAVTNEADNAV